MKYLALGDSMSIDTYTGVKGGGAASQFARRFPATEFQDLARDGATVPDVRRLLDKIDGRPDIITLTLGGNDLLSAALIVGRVPATAQAWRDRAALIAADLMKVVGVLRGLGSILDRKSTRLNSSH